jgi:hypothetical protein
MFNTPEKMLFNPLTAAAAASGWFGLRHVYATGLDGVLQSHVSS